MGILFLLVCLVLGASGLQNQYSSVKVAEPYIAMTFDDGPSKVLTPRVLDILKERKIKCTFFMLGSLALRFPDIVKRAVAEGHEIADHTWTHPQLTKLSMSQLDHEVVDTAKVLRDLSGKWPRLFRAPYGATNPVITRIIRTAYNMRVVFWTVDPEDWKKPGPRVIAQRLIEKAAPGAIMLAHDIQPQTVEAMPEMFDTLLRKGYRFVTVSQLLDLAKIEDEVGNERPGTAGDSINDGGARGTGLGGRRNQRPTENDIPRGAPASSASAVPAAPAATAAPAAPAQTPRPGLQCTNDPAMAAAAQKVLIGKGLLTGTADGQFGPRSKAALLAWLTRNSLPPSPCLTPAILSLLLAADGN